MGGIDLVTRSAEHERAAGSTRPTKPTRHARAFMSRRHHGRKGFPRRPVPHQRPDDQRLASRWCRQRGVTSARVFSLSPSTAR